MREEEDVNLVGTVGCNCRGTWGNWSIVCGNENLRGS